MHGLVCSGQMNLGVAQQGIARDWIAAYREMDDNGGQSRSNP
jgi:hypothetical protein